MQTLMLTLSAMLICSLVMGRILFWLDNTAFINGISRRLLAFIPWDYEEIKSSFLGLWYYLPPPPSKQLNHSHAEVQLAASAIVFYSRIDNFLPLRYNI